MKKLTVFLALFFILGWSGNAIEAVEANSTMSNQLPEHSIDLPQLQSELFSLKSRVNQIQADVGTDKGNQEQRNAVGMVLFLFGTVCALWAQNTGRNPWIWFFVGMFFSVIAALVMLKQNSNDRKLESSQD